MTGSHHSGTTWVGKVLASSPRVVYIHEPFNPDFAPTLAGQCRDRWFLYLTDDSVDPATRRDLARRLSLKYPLMTAFKESGTWRARARSVRDDMLVTWGRVRASRPLIKDPIALLSTDWLASEFGALPIVMIRHPAAFVASILVRDNSFDFRSLLSQDHLMEAYFVGLAEQFERYVQVEHSKLDQACLLWVALNSVVSRMRAEHPNWVFLRHEDLCAAPVAGFRQLAEYVRVPFDDRLERSVRAFSDPRYSPEGRSRGDLVRNSPEVVWIWRRRLTAGQVLRVRRETMSVAEEFYSPADWGDAMGKG